MESVRRVLAKNPALQAQVLDLIGEDNLAVWVLNQDLRVDHRPFNFDRHRYLIDIYN